jgi:hypothetical protein
LSGRFLFRFGVTPAAAADAAAAAAGVDLLVFLTLVIKMAIRQIIHEKIAKKTIIRS